MRCAARACGKETREPLAGNENGAKTQKDVKFMTSEASMSLKTKNSFKKQTQNEPKTNCKNLLPIRKKAQAKLLSRPRRSWRKSARRGGRNNLAHGVSRGFPAPLPRPPREGEQKGVETLFLGLRPGLNYSATYGAGKAADKAAKLMCSTYITNHWNRTQPTHPLAPGM